MKNYYFAVDIEYPNNKYFATVVKVAQCQNIVAVVDDWNSSTGGKLSIMSIQPSREKARQTVDYWNDCHERNKELAF